MVNMTGENDRFLLTIEPAGLPVEVEAGQTIISAAAAGGCPVRADCGGRGVCGQCRVVVSPADAFSPPTENEKRQLTNDDIASGVRLACQAAATASGRVDIPAESLETGEAAAKDIDFAPSRTDPCVSRVVFDPAGFKPAPEDGDVVTALSARVKARTGRGLDFDNPQVWRALADADSLKEPLTMIARCDGTVTAVIPGRHPRSLGAAVDLGTTTIAVYLCDLASGELAATAAGPNPQRFFGDDVISRIGKAGERGGLSALRSAAVGAVNALLAACLDRVEAAADDLDEVVVAGNTAMESILAGINPQRLGLNPYLPVSRFMGDHPAEGIGIAAAPGAMVHFVPAVSGFVGGDALAAALAVGIDSSDEVSLLVDLGTNGELVLGVGGRLWATSCATGPVFEGAHVSCGMRAARGAVAAIEVDAASCIVDCRIIGGPGVTPMGICGSGLIDAVAGMRRSDLLEPGGRFAEVNGVRPAEFVIHEAAGSARPLVVTQKDVRQVQLAKAALYVGAEFLMRAAQTDRIDRLVLTGAMGMHFNWRNALQIGLLPAAAVAGRVEQTANAAGLGAVRMLLDQHRRREAADTVSRVEVVELAADPSFQAAFVEALQFPEQQRPGEGPSLCGGAGA